MTKNKTSEVLVGGIVGFLLMLPLLVVLLIKGG